MRLIFWFLVAANFGLLVMRYGVGLPKMFLAPSFAPPVASAALDGANVAHIVLLDELKTIEQGDGGPAREASEALCRAMGPFEGASTAESFVARLSALDVGSRIQNYQISAGDGFWVYLEPNTDRKAVRRQLLDLRSRGVDCYIIPKGNLANGISLGMFSQLSSSNKRIIELKEMGFEAKYQKIERFYDEVWVVLGRGEDQKIGASAWKMLLKGKNNLKEQQKVCLDVDSQQNIH